ncbi:hypothetical protein [uncultured Flavobacterium sp.]|uniref:hypothetical protein n=1 Tax=uncultured Flavobacterium sp. TaxID=165435 RepID=UPI0025DDAF48|nr:hypothetical protein [uncultured Flavobacterium sp.]
MKKIIALFVIMLAFGVSANAQQKKTAARPATAQSASNEEAIRKAAAKDFELLSSIVALTQQQKPTIMELFETKHRTLSTPNLSDERKALFAQNIESKMKSVLDADQIAKVDSNPEMLKVLTH